MVSFTPLGPSNVITLSHVTKQMLFFSKSHTEIDIHRSVSFFRCIDSYIVAASATAMFLKSTASWRCVIFSLRTRSGMCLKVNFQTHSDTNSFQNFFYTMKRPLNWFKDFLSSVWRTLNSANIIPLKILFSQTLVTYRIPISKATWCLNHPYLSIQLSC